MISYFEKMSALYTAIHGLKDLGRIILFLPLGVQSDGNFHAQKGAIFEFQSAIEILLRKDSPNQLMTINSGQSSDQKSGRVKTCQAIPKKMIWKLDAKRIYDN